MEVLEIKNAVPADAEIICDIRDRAWIDAYPNAELGITADDIKLNAQGLDGVFVPRRIAYLKDQFTKDDTSQATFVAKIDDKVVGFTNLYIEESGRRFISTMYVAPEVQGKGIGGKLMQQAIEWLGSDHDIFLEVVSYNSKAIGFYEHFGFEKTDAVIPEEADRPIYMKSLPQTEMVLRAIRKV